MRKDVICNYLVGMNENAVEWVDIYRSKNGIKPFFLSFYQQFIRSVNRGEWIFVCGINVTNVAGSPLVEAADVLLLSSDGEFIRWFIRG